MDAFLYDHNIIISKLVQNAIIDRMQQEQETYIKKDGQKQFKEKFIRKYIKVKQKTDPDFEHKFMRARQILMEYFMVFDAKDFVCSDQQKQHTFDDFPEMYADALKFETWKKQNPLRYETMKQQYENPIERLVKIKQQFF